MQNLEKICPYMGECNQICSKTEDFIKICQLKQTFEERDNAEAIIHKDYCGYAHEGNCNKEFIYYEDMIKYKKALLKIKDILKILNLEMYDIYNDQNEIIDKIKERRC